MAKIILSKISSVAPDNFDKEPTKELTKKYIGQLSELQNLLFAQSKFSLLVILQGMDASGKDGVISEVFSGVNPMGCRVQAFKKPTPEEMDHDFLWRIHRHMPEKGMIQILNRSHYEDVVIQRVHEWVDMATIKKRYQHINAFENLVKENNTVILKFYLHVSQKEQKERLEERLSNIRKMWKYNANDLEETKRWDEYMTAYEDAFNSCGPDNSWFIVPSDKNWYKEYLIAKSIVETLLKLEMQYPRINT